MKTELDQALENYIKDPTAQAPFYDLILNSNFYIPTNDEAAKEGARELDEQSQITPVILEHEGNAYMMLFESEERLTAWAKEATPYVVLPGHVIVEMSTPQLHWALNMGTEYQKQFLPDEIDFLKGIVRQHKEAQES